MHPHSDIIFVIRCTIIQLMRPFLQIAINKISLRRYIISPNNVSTMNTAIAFSLFFYNQNIRKLFRRISINKNVTEELIYFATNI